MAKKTKSKKAKPAVKAKTKAKKAKPAKKTKAKKAKVKSKPKAKKIALTKSKKTKSKSKTKAKPAKKVAKKTVKKVTKKVAKKAAPKKKITKKIVKKASKPTVKKPIVSKPKPVVIAKTIPAPVAKVEVISENHTFVPHATSLREGMMAPYFEGIDQNGNSIKSSELIGKTVILYFYPKDDTPGCTAESCSLRDEFYYLNNNNYTVIGVSADDVESHRKFADKFSLPFPLIADTNHSIIKAYDVWGTKMFMGKIFDGIVRTTFVIDADGIIKNVVTKVDTANHAKQLLEL